MKFGGSSVADLEHIRNVAKRCIEKQQAGSQVVVVLSAMGKSTVRVTVHSRVNHYADWHGGCTFYLEWHLAHRQRRFKMARCVAGRTSCEQ